ncbi:hypothetical protein RA307_22500 [Xanthobacteraceae bacterium Astr-EGSB]|uniref:hypothetical protein n=1 Tax=Astrobacterium formosum TaxID=3069710 RepID=UPI0027B6B0FD|nr:hypothetical protein [Xanthobacteraceae bacterium Astr-EGSB]
MSVNLTAEIDNYALYLPALSKDLGEYVVRDESGRDIDLKATPLDLNFLNGDSKLWTYKWCLASAGYFAGSKRSNAVTQRDPAHSWVLGDSGGYQIGTGALRKAKAWGTFARNPDRIGRLWRESGVRGEFVRWLDANCDYAMTVDMPLWARNAKYSSSPFHHCSVDLLTELTVENLHFIDQHRGIVGNCKFLNVLQGETADEEDFWYSRIRDFDFEGWAYGSTVKTKDGAIRLLRRMLLLRDDGMLGNSKQWFHILGLSQLIWSVILTAIQRGVQKSTNSPFTISFDSCTPFFWAGKTQKYAKPPTLTTDIKSWAISQAPFPVGHTAATYHAAKAFPAGSPISSRLNIGNMNPRKSPYDHQTFDRFSRNTLGNHNAYVWLRAIIDANHVAFRGGPIPQVIADVIGLVGNLFAAEHWATLLDQNADLLKRALGRSASNDNRNTKPKKILGVLDRDAA